MEKPVEMETAKRTSRKIFMSRLQRRECRDRERLEKTRLAARTGSYHRYEETPVLSVLPDCPSSLRASDALITTADVARLELQEREHQRAIKDEFLEKRRAESLARESLKWASVSAKEAADLRRAERLQTDAFVGKKNHGGHPFDIINLDYHDSEEGRELKYHDDLCEYRKNIRKNFLAAQAHLGWNPITGTAIVDLKIPNKPIKHFSYCITM